MGHIYIIKADTFILRLVYFFLKEFFALLAILRQAVILTNYNLSFVTLELLGSNSGSH